MTGEPCALGAGVEVEMEPVREELTDDDEVRSGRDCCCGEAITRNDNRSCFCCLLQRRRGLRCCKVD